MTVTEPTEAPVQQTKAENVVLSVAYLSVEYGGERPVQAVRSVSLGLRRGEVLGLAGESGCGKSTLAYALTRLLQPPAEVTGGSVLFHETDADGRTKDTDVLALSGEALRTFRWEKIALVFQGAMNALNPVLNVQKQLVDTLAAHQPELGGKQRRARAGELLDLVGIDPSRLSSYPHQLSGGMRQRVMIAMALALAPDVVIMDEPTTALDVVVQRDILDEIDRLREMLGFAVVFITHDLSLLLEISDRIAIMYAGRIVEQGPAKQILNSPRHPYTVGLLSSFPRLRGERQDLRGVPGSPPDLSQPLTGCAFAARCPHAFDACSSILPPLVRGTDADHRTSAVACHLYDRALQPDGPPEDLIRGRFAVERVDAAERVELPTETEVSG